MKTWVNLDNRNRQKKKKNKVECCLAFPNRQIDPLQTVIFRQNLKK